MELAARASPAGEPWTPREQLHARALSNREAAHKARSLEEIAALLGAAARDGCDSSSPPSP